MPRQTTLPDPPRAPIRAMLAKAVTQRAERRLPLRITMPQSPSQGARGGLAGDQLAQGWPEMTLRRPGTFFQRLGSAGMIGFGEAFQAGDWDSDDLAGLLAVFASGVDAIVPPVLQRFRGHSAAKRRPGIEAQTIDGARRNARHHYALPNELFLAFLDETMCYSCAIFPTGDDQSVIATDSSLADAQHRKLERLLDLAQVGPGTRLLEIGTGWGELPVLAARRGARVRTVTNMAEHAELAGDRIAKAGVADLVRIELCDYREIVPESGGFDAIVSVEMIEAVGPAYWPAYFRTLDSLLAPQGKIGLQAMTMPHERMLKTSSTYTWIDKYIFPGGVIPSIEAIEAILARETGLRVLDRYTFGEHYQATLALWRRRFNENWPTLAQLGFDETFRRTWNFYLAFCEAGFESGYLNVHQFLIGR
ncbi:MAG TPA: cyclopropane-fatty-acyl-phospholipid synthase family protein [Streptosporangiaceae bacterium]